MTDNQQKILIFCIEKVTGISPTDPLGIIKLKSWVTDKDLKIIETSIRASFGNPAYTCELVQNQVTLHKSSKHLPEAAFLNCLGEYCKNEFILANM